MWHFSEFWSCWQGHGVIPADEQHSPFLLPKRLIFNTSEELLLILWLQRNTHLSPLQRDLECTCLPGEQYLAVAVIMEWFQLSPTATGFIKDEPTCSADGGLEPWLCRRVWNMVCYRAFWTFPCLVSKLAVTAGSFVLHPNLFGYHFVLPIVKGDLTSNRLLLQAKLKLPKETIFWKDERVHC